MNKKFLFVTTHFIPDYHYGGIVESGSKLYKYLKKISDFKISTVSYNPTEVYKYISNDSKCYKSLYLHRFAFSINAIYGLWHDVKNADILLINGIFTFPVTLAQLYAVILKKPFIVATRGGLEPWRVSHKKWKKYFYIKFITLPLMRKAEYIHVTSDQEERDIRELGFSNTMNISNGIDIDTFSILPEKYSYSNKYDNKFVFLFLSRTDKEKGIDILIEAYRMFCDSFGKRGHLLLIVGPDHQGYLKRFNLDYKNENIEYINGVYGDEKIKLIRRSDVVLLPSYSENFGNIIAEAFACERPVITTTGTPWNEIEKIGCGYYIRPNKDELFEAMKIVYKKNKDEREEMGIKGRKYIFENFSWEAKAQEIYKYLKQLSDER